MGRRPTVARPPAPAAAARPAASPPASEGGFEVRGIVQGFYGRTWTATERRETLRWMADHGMNVYVHAPKDDVYQRAQWRDPWPSGLLADLLEEVAEARRLGITWVPNVSPAVPVFPGVPENGNGVSRDICYSSPDDLEVLCSKLDPFVDAGASTVMLSFDDSHPSRHERDLAAYPPGSLGAGAMTRDLLNAVHRRYAHRPGGVRLLTVLASYWGTEDGDYLRGVRGGPGLDDGIDVLWTGAQIISSAVTAADAATYARLVGRRRVVLWDNYPVNDYTSHDRVPTRLFLGPYEGRDPRLAGAVSGVLANPMSHVLASRLALATIAEYLADPLRYRPGQAWRRAVLEVAGGDAEAVDALTALADNSRSSPLRPRESPGFGRCVGRLLRDLRGPFWTGAAAELEAELEREELAPGVLRRRLPLLAKEVNPFLDRLAGNARLAAAAVELLAALRPALAVHARPAPGGSRVEGHAVAPSARRVRAAEKALLAARDEALADPVAVHGDRVGNDHFTIRPGRHRLDRLVEAAAAQATAWGPAADDVVEPLRLTVAGRPAPLDAAGRFAVDVAGTGPLDVLVTDAVGGATGVRLTPPG